MGTCQIIRGNKKEKKKKTVPTDKNPFTQNKQVKTVLNKKMKQISNKNPLYIVTNSWWNR